MVFNYYYGTEAEQFSFIRIPKVMLTEERFTPLSLAAKILYGVLLDRMALSVKNGWLDKEKKVWQLVSEGDLKLYYEIIKSRKMLILGKLIKRLYEPHPQRLNIVTTNYDRVIEYACDQVNVPIDKRFEGYYDKTFSSSPIKKKDVVNIIKVHGSLDLFRHTDGFLSII